MSKASISLFKGKNVLLLQGPVGPFFSRLAQDLISLSAKVHKVNFNGGDWLFYPTNAISFKGKLDEWPDFFDQLLADYSIDVILLLGDCRAHHQVALNIARLRAVEIGVFEEGYIRPDFITLEFFGANNNSLLPREAAYYQVQTPAVLPEHFAVGKTFSYAAMWAMIYYLACSLLWPVYWRYRHHRPLNLFEGLYWVRSLWRKKYYAHKERNVLQDLAVNHQGQYFLVPLQIHNDAQIYFHSNYVSVKDFIHSIINSFVKHAPNKTLLVIKHHPLDRGYHDYAKYIASLAKLHGVADRVRYIHDQHLPTLFNHALGVVVVNSTVGMSALNHGLPVMVSGRALYDIPGLTFQGTVDEFWQSASSHHLDKKLLDHFLHYLISNTQLNGSFYKRLKNQDSTSGINLKIDNQ